MKKNNQDFYSATTLTIVTKYAVCLDKTISNINVNSIDSTLIKDLVIPIKTITNFLQYLTSQWEGAGVPVVSAVKKITINLKKHWNTLTEYLRQQNKNIQTETELFIEQNFEGCYLVSSIKQKKHLFADNVIAKTHMGSILYVKDIEEHLIKESLRDNCLGCLTSFEEGAPVPQTQQFFSMIRARSINSLLEDDIKKKACSLLNCGGGYLLIGDSFNKLKMKALDITEEEKNKLRIFVSKTIKQRLFPNDFHIQISEIKSQSISKNKSNNQNNGSNGINGNNQNNQNNHKNQNNQNNHKNQRKVILRVALSPNEQNGLYFVEKKVTNYPATYSCYFLNTEAIGSMNDVCMLENSANIGRIMTKYKTMTRFKEKIVHRKGCVTRNNHMQNVISHLNSQKPNEKISFVKTIIEDPVCKYRNQSVLIFYSQAQDYYIDIIKKVLDQKKMYEVTFSKCYEFCRSNSMKSMWFVDYSFDLPALKQVIEEVISQKECQKKKNFALIGCTKSLIIQKGQFSDLRDDYQRSFQEYFGQTPNICKNIKGTFLIFNNLKYSFFSFKFLDNKKIKTKFVKENNNKNYTKKF